MKDIASMQSPDCQGCFDANPVSLVAEVPIINTSTMAPNLVRASVVGMEDMLKPFQIVNTQVVQ